MRKLRLFILCISLSILFSCGNSTDQTYFLECNSIESLSPKTKVYSNNKYVGIVEEIQLVNSKVLIKIKVFNEFKIAQKHSINYSNKSLLEKIIVIENHSNSYLEYGSKIVQKQLSIPMIKSMDLDSLSNDPKGKEILNLLNKVDSFSKKKTFNN
jgi:hypothetical protein